MPPIAPTAPGAVPVGPEYTGTSPGAGTTSELLGFGCGTTVMAGGGICAAAAAADSNKTVSARQGRRIVFIKYPG